VLVAVIVLVVVIVGLTVTVMVIEDVGDMVSVDVMVAVCVIVGVTVIVGEIVGVPTIMVGVDLVSGEVGVLFFAHPKIITKIKTTTAARTALKDFFISFFSLLCYVVVL
jgi:hypothetical protein